jgi:hypothetical protein
VKREVVGTLVGGEFKYLGLQVDSIRIFGKVTKFVMVHGNVSLIRFQMIRVLIAKSRND